MLRERQAVNGAVGIAFSEEPLNGGGPTVLFIHATGFCKEVWRPVIARVADLGVGCVAVAADQRGHGSSGKFDHPLDWWQLGGDVGAVLAGSSEVIGVGHSSGGAALAMAELVAPGTFRSLVLVEPIIPEPPFGRRESHPLAIGALRRTTHFRDREAAAAKYRERGAFVGWDHDAFAGYLEGGIKPDPSGSDFELACDPHDEAEFYRSAYAHGAWSRLGELDAPVEIVAGEGSDTHSPRYVGLMAGRIERVRVTWVPDTNHFVAMQRPDVIGDIVAAAVTGERSA